MFGHSAITPFLGGMKNHKIQVNKKYDVFYSPHIFRSAGSGGVQRDSPDFRAHTRVLGLPIRDCARGFNNRGQSRPIMSAIDMTAKTFFESLYLVLGLHKIAPWVNSPYAPTTPTVHTTTISRFLCNFFPRMAPHFFGHHDSSSNLAKSW